MIKSIGGFAIGLVSVLSVGGAIQVPGSFDLPKKPKMVIEDRHIDLGSIRDGEKPEITFVIQNRGEAPLIIDSAKADCGCTLIELAEEDKNIQAGGELRLVVRFDSTGRSSQGAQKKTLVVKTNDPAESEVTLEFEVHVQSLYHITPLTGLHLQTLRRGEESTRPLTILPGSVGKPVEVREVRIPEELPVHHRVEAIEENGLAGHRLHFKANDDAPLGVIDIPIVLVLAVDGENIERKVTIQGTIVGDVEVRPLILNLVNQRLSPGRSLTPIHVASTTKRPLRILKTEGGPILEFEIRPGARRDGTEHVIQPKIRSDAPPGPFAAMIRIATDSIDQPVVEVPIFGMVTARVEVDPSDVILRDDGTAVGSRRHVKLLVTGAAKEFRIGRVDCDLSLVAGKRGNEAGEDNPSVENLIVYLLGELPSGRQTGTLTVETSLPDCPVLKIPVTVLSKTASFVEEPQRK